MSCDKTLFPRITIHNLGPIADCELNIKDFTVLTGRQASGKSTIAKAVYFCETIKNDILSQFMMPKNEDSHSIPPMTGIAKRLRSKFLKVFGSTWAMPSDMSIVYDYKENIYVRISLKKDDSDSSKNFVNIEFCPEILGYIRSNSSENWQDLNVAEFKAELDALFGSPYECVYVPAGRGMITLLTDQLNYIFTGVDEIANVAVDYCTRSYVERILKIRPVLNNGLEGLLNDKLHYSQDKIDRVATKQMLEFCKNVLKGHYHYISGEERLQIADDKYVKINYASSGQQETVWIFNLMFYYLLNRRKILFILEELEAHLYPDAQQTTAKALGLFVNSGNKALITTHSPYILGEFNNLLYASKIPAEDKRREKIIKSNCILDPKTSSAFYLDEGRCEQAMDSEYGLILSELIDGASTAINEEHDNLMELIWENEEKRNG